MLRKNLIMVFLVVVATLKTLSTSYESYTTINSSKTFYKNDITLSTSYVNNDYILLPDKIEEDVSNIVSSEIEIPSINLENNDDETRQTSDISKLEYSTSMVNSNKKTNHISESMDLNNDDVNEQRSDISKSENSNSNVVVDKKTNDISEIIETNNNYENEQVSDTSKPEIPTIYYDRTTSIYANDNETLLRVEYYVDNKLNYYSAVEQFDVITNSYLEKIYRYDYETNNEILVRTDIYSNGILTNSY